MKLKEGFILRTVAGETVALPTGETANLDMMITLNETGKFLWERLNVGAEHEDLVDALLEVYDVDRETADASVRKFVEKLKELNFLA